ncbi:hypothetical protein HYV79_01010 [Candidatus Woesearchaeota archaeon]|nr:hypothetical protein [Candidatus Woesearchaeota archaeon]
MRWIIAISVILIVLPLTNAVVFDYYIGEANSIHLLPGQKQELPTKQFMIYLNSCGSVARNRCSSLSSFNAVIDSVSLPGHNPGVDVFACYTAVSEKFVQTISFSGTAPNKVDDHKCNFNAYADAFLFENFTKKQASASFSDKEAKPLGSVEELLGPVNVNEATVFSASNDVIVWIGTDMDFGIKKTRDFTKNAWACLDSNHNQQCDYIDGKECIAKKGSWYNGFCCGVDYNPGYYSTLKKTVPVWGLKTQQIDVPVNSICGTNVEGKYQWLPLEEVGEPRSSLEPEGLFVSDGTKFFNCGGDKDFMNLHGIPKLDKSIFTYKGKSNEYLCQNEEIISCGGNTPFSELSKNPGEKINYKSKEYYCSSSGLFVDDLDKTDESTCNNAGFIWTGTKCCGDPEEKPEYYNDPYNSSKVKQGLGGGCWNSNFVARGRTIPDDQGIINHQGEFYSCKFPTNQALLLQVKNEQECTVLPESVPEPENYKHAVCQPNGKWVIDNDSSAKSKKSISWNPNSNQIVQGCCSSSQCWDGNQCKNLNEYIAISDDEGFQCTAQGWQAAKVKHRWDRKTDAGFCELASQCLVDPSGDFLLNGKPEAWFENKKPQCINDSQYILDPICDDGSWTSRTRNIALSLITVAEQDSPNDYTLFCGNYDEVLPYLDYSVSRGDVKQYFESFCKPFNSQDQYPCVNNVCALKFSKGVAFGASLNIPINDDEKSFLYALDLDKNFCSNIDITANFYEECSPGQLSKSSLFYNPKQQSILYLPKGSIPFPLTYKTAFDRFIKQPLDTLITYAKTISTLKMPLAQFFTKLGILNNLYASSKNGVRVFAFLEKHQTKQDASYLGIKYSSTEFSEQLCSEFFKLKDVNAQCLKQPLPFDFLLISKSYPGEKSLVDFWNELTGGLRL